MFKRDLHLFLRCLIPAAVLAALLGAACAAAAVAAAQGAEKIYTPVKAAVVDGEKSVLSRMLIRTVAETDYIRDLLQIEVCDEEAAAQGLASGEYAAVIELPQDFIGDILHGAEKKGRITLSSAAARNSEIVASVAAFGELLLASGQYAAFGSDTVIGRHVSDEHLAEELLTIVNNCLLAEAFTAQSHYFVVTVTDYADTGVSLAAHYLMSWLAALAGLSLVMFEHLYRADSNRSMLLRLRVSGITAGRYLVWKIVPVGAFVLLVFFAGAGILSRWMTVQWSAAAILSALAAAGLTAATAAAVLLVVKNGSGLWMAATLVELFLCGGIVPRQMLAEPILLVGDLTVLGAARSLLAPMFGGAFHWMGLTAAIGWSALAVMVMVLHLHRLQLKGGAE